MGDRGRGGLWGGQCSFYALPEALTAQEETGAEIVTVVEPTDAAVAARRCGVGGEASLVSIEAADAYSLTGPVRGCRRLMASLRPAGLALRRGATSATTAVRWAVRYRTAVLRGPTPTST